MKRALIIRHAEPETLAANFIGVLEATRISTRTPKRLRVFSRL